MGNLFRSYALGYFPITDWRRFVSPTIVFGNVGAADGRGPPHAVPAARPRGCCRQGSQASPGQL